MSSLTYINRAVTEVKPVLAEAVQRLKTKFTTTMSDKYRDEFDSNPKLDSKRITYYQGLIGELRWLVELGWINIMVAVAMLSSHLRALRQEHLEKCFHIFDYLDSHENLTLFFNPSYRSVDESSFVSNDWSQYYPDAAEAIPHNIPHHRGKDLLCDVIATLIIQDVVLPKDHTQLF
jgi:hypothetical protein